MKVGDLVMWEYWLYAGYNPMGLILSINDIHAFIYWYDDNMHNNGEYSIHDIRLKVISESR